MHWRRKWHPLQCSCLKNPRDGGAWWAAVYGVAQSRTWLKWLSSSSEQNKYHSWQMWFSWAPKSMWMVTAVMKLKDVCSLEESCYKPRQCIKKKRHRFANESLYSQSCGFSNSHVQMSELYHKEGWAPKNSCFWTVVLEKTLENPLDRKEIKPVNPKGNQSWIFIEKTDAEAAAPILWPPDAENWLIKKGPDAGK